MVICLERDADLHMAQLMQLPLTVSCFSKIQIGFTFLAPAHPGSPGKRAVKRVCLCSICGKQRVQNFTKCLQRKVQNLSIPDPPRYCLVWLQLQLLDNQQIVSFLASFEIALSSAKNTVTGVHISVLLLLL